MNLKRAVFLLTMLVSCAGAARGFGAADTERSKIVVYYFQNIGTTSEYGYYSYIIPDTIATDIRKVPKYDVQSIPVVMDYTASTQPEDAYKTRIRLLSDRGKEFNAHYIITGSYAVENRRITIKTQIFDVDQQKIKDIGETTEELGALLLVVIDKLTTKINNELQKSIAIQKEKNRNSPFAPPYMSLKGISFGINYSTAAILGEWGNIYQNKFDIAGVYIAYDMRNNAWLNQTPFVRGLTASAQYDFFTANTHSTAELPQSYLSFRGLSFNAEYRYGFSPVFSAFASAGIGEAYSKVEIVAEGSYGPGTAIESRESFNTYATISTGAHFIVHSLIFTAGYNFKWIYYTDKPMSISSLFFGIGYSL